MQLNALLQKRSVKWGLVFLLWTTLGLLFVFQGFIYNVNYSGREFNWIRTFSYQLSNYWLWALLTPLIYLLSRRFPLDRQNLVKNISIHAGFSLMIAPLQRLASVLANFLILSSLGQLDDTVAVMLDRAKFGIIGGSIDSLMLYWTILIACFSIAYYQKYQQQELISSQLETQLAQAQLQALKMQLHPHFLFNTLHAISTLMDEDVKTARRMLVRLSELLRVTLENAGTQEVTLKKELEMLNRYLEIEQIRFQDRLKINLQIDPEALDARVPNLILQPIVENAIRHGIAPISRAGNIDIRAKRSNGKLRLQVQDDGIGISEQQMKTLVPGVGLSNTKNRLAQLYGEKQLLDLSNIENSGLLVSVEIPFHTEGEKPSETDSAFVL